VNRKLWEQRLLDAGVPANTIYELVAIQEKLLARDDQVGKLTQQKERVDRALHEIQCRLRGVKQLTDQHVDYEHGVVVGQIRGLQFAEHALAKAMGLKP
jgi:hypothetical protein